MEYRCNDIFMIRIPSLSIEVFENLLLSDMSENNVLEFSKENYVYDFLNESIFLASQDMHSLLKGKPENVKKEKSFNLSLLKYFIRATTRPTPYGLFASAGLGEFSDCNENDEIIYSENLCIRDVKVDTYWLCEIIHKLEKKYEILSNLSLKFNPLCYNLDSRQLITIVH